MMSTNQRTELGYVPFLRPGALIFTVIAWRYQWSGSVGRCRTIADVYGSIGGRKRNLFGERIGPAAAAIFGDSQSPREVLLRHTMFGIYSRGMSAAASDAWSKGLIQGKKRIGLPSQLYRRGTFQPFALVSRDLRSCEECWHRDMDESGFSSWYALHMLPPLDHCAYHGLQLATEVEGGKSTNMWPLRLPLNRPARPLVRKLGVACEGYASYLGLWRELFEGRLPVIAADKWAHCMRKVLRHWSSVEDAVSDVSREIERAWNVAPSHLASLLGDHVQSNFVGVELGQHSRPSRIAQRLIVMDACKSLGVFPTTKNIPEQSRLPFSTLNHAPVIRARVAVLSSALLDMGYPIAVALTLSEGGSRSVLAKAGEVHRHQLQAIVASLSDETLETLRQIGEWSPASWLTEELMRRDCCQ